MSSSDGGDSANGSTGRTPDDHDPVRLSPPEDPWLAEAPTSVLGDTEAPAGQVPPADTARFAGAVPPDDPPPGWVATPQPQGRRGRRATRWIVAVLAVVALFIAGMLAQDQFGSGSSGDNDALGSGPSAAVSQEATAGPARTGGATKPAATEAPAVAPVGKPSAGPAGGQPGAATSGRPDSSAGGPVVIYEVTASGSANTGSVSYTDQDGDIIRRNGIALPWRVTFSLGAQRKPPLVLISQRTGGGDAGPVTCTITLDGKVLSATTAEGRYASAQCSG